MLDACSGSDAVTCAVALHAPRAWSTLIALLLAVCPAAAIGKVLMAMRCRLLQYAALSSNSSWPSWAAMANT